MLKKDCRHHQIFRPPSFEDIHYREKEKRVSLIHTLATRCHYVQNFISLIFKAFLSILVWLCKSNIQIPFRGSPSLGKILNLKSQITYIWFFSVQYLAKSPWNLFVKQPRPNQHNRQSHGFLHFVVLIYSNTWWTTPENKKLWYYERCNKVSMCQFR